MMTMSDNTRKTLRYLLAIWLPLWLCAGTVFLLMQQGEGFMLVIAVLALVMFRADWALRRQTLHLRDDSGDGLFVDEGAMLLQWRQGIDLSIVMTLHEFIDTDTTDDDAILALRDLLHTPPTVPLSNPRKSLFTGDN